MNDMRRMEFEPRMSEALAAVGEALEPFKDYYVIEVTVCFMPVDGRDNECIEAPFAKARIGSFRRAQ